MRLTIRPTSLLAIGTLSIASIALVSAAATSAAAADEVILEQHFEGGAVGEEADVSPLWPSDNPTLTWVADPDDETNTAVLVSDRSANHYSVSSPGTLAGEPLLDVGTEYTLSVRVRLAHEDDSPQTVRLTNNENYSTLGGDSASGSVTADEWTALVGTYTPGATERNVYPEAPADVDILVDDFVVTVTGDGGTPEPCVPETSTVGEYGFEDGTEGWYGRGGAEVDVSDEARSGESSLGVTERGANWHGAELDAASLLTEGEYELSAWVKLPEGETGTADFALTVIQTVDGEQDYVQVDTANTVGAGDWVELSDSFAVNPSAPVQVVYIEVTSGLDDFLVDDVLINGMTPCGDGPAPGTVALSTDFEDGLDGWGPRHASGDDTVEVSLTDEAHDSDQAALVSQRTSQGSGLGIEVTDLLEPATQYEISAWIKFAEGQEADNVVLSLQRGPDDDATYTNLVTGEGMSNSEWVELTGTFPSGAAWDYAFLYFETQWESGNDARNTSDFLVDDIRVSVPEPALVQDLTPLHDTLDMPVGVAIDSRETSGPPAELLLRHFDQVTPENHMKVENWYNSEREFARHAEATAILDFARDNNIGVFGHVLVWHSQTPAWFFQDEDGRDLTDAPGDQDILRDRLAVHIDNVAKSIYDDYGPYGSEGNPVVGFDVVNEVVSDQETDDGLRRSALYRVLGEEYIHLAFELADEAFNDTYAAEGVDNPVLLYINEYNTEQSMKGDQYEALIRRMVDAGTPFNGVGHQFHLSVNASIPSMRAALDRFVGLDKQQAVTEFDVTINPANEASRVRQGHFYREAFAMFRDYHATAPASEKLSSITIWGLTDNRSWRSDQQPLMFDGGLQAKPAYYGAIGDDENLPDLITTADVFGGDVPLADGFEEAVEWRNLPENVLTGGVGGFQTRWNDDHLTVLVRSTVDPDLIEFTYEGEEYVYDSASSDSVPGRTALVDGEHLVAVHLPHSGVSEGDTGEFDVRVVVGDSIAGAWNSAGATGQLTFLESLSYMEVPQLDAPEIDGDVDDVWADAAVAVTGTVVEGEADGAQAEVRTLWQGDTLYVLYEVTDPVIDASNSDAWNKDSVELFLDLGNNKSGTYGPNDTQIRVTLEGDLSFGTGDAALQLARVQDHAVEMTEVGYNVELAVALVGQSGGQSDVPLGGENAFHGIDFQINDGRDSARYAVHTWAEPTGTGYQNTARWGVIEQVGQLTDGGGDNGGGDNGGGDNGGGDNGGGDNGGGDNGGGDNGGGDNGGGDNGGGDNGGGDNGGGDNGGGDNGGGDNGGGDNGSGDGLLTEDEVRNSDDGGIDVPETARPGETITVRLGIEHAGVATQTYLYSEPTLIGQSIADSEGNIRVTIPLDTTPGEHTLAVYDADGELIGWSTLTVLAADGTLSATGAEGFMLPASIALVLMLLGAAMVARRRSAPAEL